MASDFQIGASTSVYDFLQIDELLPNMGIPIDPDWSFQPFSISQRAGDGTVKGQGFPVAIWRWNALTFAQRAALRTLCTDLSAPVYIRTATNEIDVYGDLVFKTYSAIMVWPEEDETIVVESVLSFVLRFTHLIEVEP